MQRSSASNGPGISAKYACPCLNIKISPSLVNRASSNTQASGVPAPPPGWEAICVDASSIQIAYEQLTLKSRSPEHGSHVVCLLCNIIVYRVVEDSNSPNMSSSSSSNVTSPVGISASIMSPTTRERLDFQKLFQRDKENQAWIYINAKGGCVSGRQLEDILSKASPIFGLNIPVIETISPAPTPPSNTIPLPSPSLGGPTSGTGSNLTTSMSHQLNLNWPEFIPPPPFVPSHPLYAHLARIAKKASSSARTEAEASIQSFIHAKRREVAEYEAGLRRQVNTVWRVWRDSTDKERSGSNPASSTADYVFDPRSTTKRHASNTSTSSTTSSGAAAGQSTHKATVIRNFQEDPTVSPRASDPHIIPLSSSFSPSTATPRVQPRMSALGTSLVQSGMHMPRYQHESPVSPSSRAADSSELRGARSSSRTPPGNSNTIHSRKSKDGTGKSRSKERLSVNTSAGDSTLVTSTTEGSAALDNVSEDSFKVKKKAVTFSSKEPDVVTVARDIRSEKLQKIKDEHAKGEEAMFDLDIDGDHEIGANDASSGSKSTGRTDQPSTHRVTGFDTSSEQEENLPGVTLSFKNRPSKYTMARSLPQTRHGILASTSADEKMPDALESNGPHAYSVQDQSLLSTSPSTAAPYNNELLKLVAGQTPSHRKGWTNNTGGNEEEDEDSEDSEEYDDAEETRVVSKSVPRDIPAMRSTAQPSKAADSDFENAMSKSHDPGPALELLTLNNRDDEDDEEEEDFGNASTSQTVNNNDERQGTEGASEEADLMKRLMEGRGSLHAQKILSQAERAAPTNMWKSMI